MLLKMENIMITPATKTELQPIKELLKQASLPFEDIDTHINNFLIARMDENIIGAIGLEIYDDNALLRSIVVMQEMRNHGKGQKIYDAVIAFAKGKNIKTIYLLTETAEKFFTRNGFTKIDRNTAPEKILNTEEFKTLCAATAIAMMKHI